MSTGLAYLCRWLFCIVLMFGAGQTMAEADSDACQLSAISTDFRQYLQKIDRTGVVRIQGQLNAIGYGPINTDGVMGPDTRLALQKFCQVKQVSDAPDGIAKTLVVLLEQATAEGLPSNVMKAVSSPQPASAASIFYRWSVPEEEEAEAEAPTIAQEEQVKSDTAAPDDAISGEVLEKLAEIEAVAYPNQMLFKKALAALFAGTGVDYKLYQDRIIEQARVGPIEDVKQIQLKGDGCGCSRDYSSVVYGFYPYWLADEAVQTVDFSLFDRIGFFALSLNQEGRVQTPLQWDDDWNAAAFINKAHKYRVAVDVTVYASGWQKWTDKLLQSAVDSTAQKTKQHFSSHASNRFAEMLPLLEKTSSVQGDGVTLVFEDYSGSAEMSHKISAFVNKLSDNLSAEERDYKLNIMLDMDLQAHKNTTPFSDLEAILLGKNKDGLAKVEHVFVFLQAPTTDAKKILRRMIEDQFRGPDRRQVLRKIVPVISAAGHDKDPRGPFTQFEDDLIYFQDNFYGVGLWPLPLDSDPGVETVKAKIIELYTDSNGDNHIGDLVDQFIPELCQFACPNRWLLRVSFDLLAGLILLYAVLAIWIYRLRTVYQQYFWYFLVVAMATVLIFLTSLVCDPYWQARADFVVGLLILIVLVATIFRYVSKATRPPLP